MLAASAREAIPPISLTTFVDFVLASGTPRLTCIRNAKAMYSTEYHPPFDFYKQLREFIIEMHSAGKPASALDRFVVSNANAKKAATYRECVASYKKLMGSRPIEWTGSEAAKWEIGDLSVKVNPELGLRIDGVNHVVKLYFKQPQPSKLRLETMLHLLEKVLPKNNKPAIPAILDVPRGKLIVPTVRVNGLDALLAGEAAAFVAMWRAV
jgi:hypothetical protein